MWPRLQHQTVQKLQTISIAENSTNQPEPWDGLTAVTKEHAPLSGQFSMHRAGAPAPLGGTLMTSAPLERDRIYKAGRSLPS